MQKKMTVSIILLVVAVLMVTDFNVNGVAVFEHYVRQLETDSMQQINGSGQLNPENIKEKAVKKSSLIIDASDISQLQMDNVMGSIKIIGSEREDVRVEYQITVFALSTSQAEEFIKQLTIEKEINGGQLSVLLKRVSIPAYIRGIRVDYTIQAPRRLNLDLNNRYGTLEASGFAGNLELRNTYDRMNISDISGSVKADARYGDLRIDGVEGITTVQSYYNNAEIRNISNNLDLQAGYADLRTDNVTGRMDVNCKYGSLSLRDISGPVDINARYTDVDGEVVRNEMAADLSYGRLTLFDVNAGLDITANYTDLKVQLAQEFTDFTVDCDVHYGNISSDLPLEVKEDGTRESLLGTVGSGGPDLKLVTNHADVTIRR